MRHELMISSLDKVRIIALYILFRDGVADEDRRRLYQHARLSISEQDTINNLIYLGLKVIKVCQVEPDLCSANLKQDPKERPRGSRIKPPKPQVTEGEYELSRYRPIVQMVLEVSSAICCDARHG
jgi:syntaxin-binding protein 1